MNAKNSIDQKKYIQVHNLIIDLQTEIVNNVEADVAFKRDLWERLEKSRVLVSNVLKDSRNVLLKHLNGV